MVKTKADKPKAVKQHRDVKPRGKEVRFIKYCTNNERSF